MRNRPDRPTILQLITTLDPGGAEHQLLTLCKLLQKRFRFTVAYFKGRGGLVPHFEGLDIPIQNLRIRSWTDPVCLLRLVLLIRRVRPDLVVTHLFKADVYGWAAVLPTTIPLISHKHNEDQYLLNPIFGALGRVAAARCHTLVSISDAVTRFFTEKAAFPAEKFVRILHGIEVNLDKETIIKGTPSTTLEIRHHLGTAEEDILIGTVARLTPQKGIATLLRATKLLFSRDERYRCIIVGQGEEEVGLKAVARDLGIENRVRFVGYRPDVPAILDALDVFVLPSLWEGFGIVLLEAMAHGCPVVASCSGGIPEVVEDGVTGVLVPPADPEALSRAIDRLIREEASRRALTEAARLSLERRFSADRMARDTAALYEEAISSRSAP